MTDLVEGRDYGTFPDGTPWVKWYAVDEMRREPPPITKRSETMDEELLSRITAKIARHVVERFGKRRGVSITTVDGIPPDVIAHVQKNRVAQDPVPLTRDDPVEAIHKSNADPVLAPNHYELLQKRVAAANAIEIAKIKGKVPHAGLAQPDSSKDKDDDKDIDWSDDKIATLHYRAEKARKAQNHDGENSRPARPMTGENLNPRPLSP